MTLSNILQVTLSLLVRIAKWTFLHIAVFTVSPWGVARDFIWLRSCFWIRVEQHACFCWYGLNCCNYLLITLVLTNSTSLATWHTTNLTRFHLYRVVGDRWILIRNLLKDARHRTLSCVVFLLFGLLDFAVRWGTFRLWIQVRLQRLRIKIFRNWLLLIWRMLLDCNPLVSNQFGCLLILLLLHHQQLLILQALTNLSAFQCRARSNGLINNFSLWLFLLYLWARFLKWLLD